MDTSKMFPATIDTQGVIWYVEGNRKKYPIGIDNRLKEEQEEIIENYYNKLVEIGIIEIPKTPEEIAKEQADEELRILRAEQEEQRKINLHVMETLSKISERLDKKDES